MGSPNRQLKRQIQCVAPVGLVLLFLLSAPAQDRAQVAKSHLPDRYGHHPVHTQSQGAQDLFDEGLGLIYALDYSGAAKVFRRAAAADPGMTMAYWGIAYALGSDYYYATPADPKREQEAYGALKRASVLAEHGPEAERAYIDALSKRYCDCGNPDRKKQAIEFKSAMGDLAHSYPDDLDAATLYAQSIMNLSPWELWNVDGTPWKGTPEILAILESVLRRNPGHWGAMHFYIHAMEGSPNPERALVYARALPSLAPPIGHLVHMPAHIFIRTGDYAAAESACLKAAQLDEKHLQDSSDMFTVLSYLHDLYFLAAAASMGERFPAARDAAGKLSTTVAPHLKQMPELQIFLTLEPAVLVRFRRWNEILALPQPDAPLDTANAFWHFARGMAFASKGDVRAAEAEQHVLAEQLGQTPSNVIFGMSAVNKTKDILQIASAVLAAKLDTVDQNRSQAILHLQDAVTIQDTLKYSEPPSWFYPVRESLGAALFLDGQASAAKQIFREDLQRNPRNPRSLFGLLQALRSDGDNYDASFVLQQLQTDGQSDLKRFDLRGF